MENPACMSIPMYVYTIPWTVSWIWFEELVYALQTPFPLPLNLLGEQIYFLWNVKMDLAMHIIQLASDWDGLCHNPFQNTVMNDSLVITEEIWTKFHCKKREQTTKYIPLYNSI